MSTDAIINAYTARYTREITEPRVFPVLATQQSVAAYERWRLAVVQHLARIGAAAGHGVGYVWILMRIQGASLVATAIFTAPGAPYHVLYATAYNSITGYIAMAHAIDCQLAASADTLRQCYAHLSSYPQAQLVTLDVLIGPPDDAWALSLLAAVESYEPRPIGGLVHRIILNPIFDRLTVVLRDPLLAAAYERRTFWRPMNGRRGKRGRE